ncbi:hypothetical protein H4S03_002434 [Coemansia sp. S3946]|nr:hypothetical protein H4S03_002434 [Coemansia sp. S3946]
MKKKSEVFDKFKLYVAKMEHQLDAKVKILRSDNGGKYLNAKSSNTIPFYFHESSITDVPMKHGLIPVAIDSDDEDDSDDDHASNQDDSTSEPSHNELATILHRRIAGILNSPSQLHEQPNGVDDSMVDNSSFMTAGNELEHDSYTNMPPVSEQILQPSSSDSSETRRFQPHVPSSSRHSDSAPPRHAAAAKAASLIADILAREQGSLTTTVSKPSTPWWQVDSGDTEDEVEDSQDSLVQNNGALFCGAAVAGPNTFGQAM